MVIEKDHDDVSICKFMYLFILRIQCYNQS